MATERIGSAHAAKSTNIYKVPVVGSFACAGRAFSAAFEIGWHETPGGKAEKLIGSVGGALLPVVPMTLAGLVAPKHMCKTK